MKPRWIWSSFALVLVFSRFLPASPASAAGPEDLRQGRPDGASIAATHASSKTADAKPAVALGPGWPIMHPDTVSVCSDVVQIDFLVQTAIAWQYDGVSGADFGSFAEGFTSHECSGLCGVLLMLSQAGGLSGQKLDLVVWGSDGHGFPGDVLAFRPNLSVPGTIATWPGVSSHEFSLEVSGIPGDFFVGYRGAWPGDACGFYCAADTSRLGPSFGPGSFTRIAPGLGYPSGWQDVNVVWPSVEALAIGCFVPHVAGTSDGACCHPDGTCSITKSCECDGHFLGTETFCGEISPDPCRPEPTVETSWGRVKLLYR